MKGNGQVRPAVAMGTGGFVRQSGFSALVVDDSEIDRHLNSALLEEAFRGNLSMQVDYAGDGQEALAKLASARFELILLDWSMPKMGGRQVLRTIRQNGPPVPVVVVTGLEPAELDEDLGNLRAAFISKDQLSVESLRDAVQSSLKMLGACPGTPA